VHLPDEIERVYLKHLAHEEPNFELLDSLDESGDELPLVDDTITLNGLRHLKRHLVKLHRLVTGNQKLLWITCGDPHVSVGPEDPVVIWVIFDRPAMLNLHHQLGDGFGKPMDRVVDAELIGAVQIDLAAARAIEQQLT